MRGTLGINTCGNRFGERENLESDQATTKNSTYLKCNTEARVGPLDVARRLDFYAPTSISHCIQVASKEAWLRVRQQSTAEGHFQEHWELMASSTQEDGAVWLGFLFFEMGVTNR